MDTYCCSLLSLDTEAKNIIAQLLGYVLPCNVDHNYCLTHRERNCQAAVVRERAKDLLLKGSRD